MFTAAFLGFAADADDSLALHCDTSELGQSLCSAQWEMTEVWL